MATISKRGRPKGYSPKLGRMLTAKELAQKKQAKMYKPVKIPKNTIKTKVSKRPTNSLVGLTPSKVVFDELVAALNENSELLRESNKLTMRALERADEPGPMPGPIAKPVTEAVDPWENGTSELMEDKDPLAPNDDVASIMNS